MSSNIRYLVWVLLDNDKVIVVTLRKWSRVLDLLADVPSWKQLVITKSTDKRSH